MRHCISIIIIFGIELKGEHILTASEVKILRELLSEMKGRRLIKDYEIKKI